jgi:hypothetical protein
MNRLLPDRKNAIPNGSEGNLGVLTDGFAVGGVKPGRTTGVQAFSTLRFRACRAPRSTSGGSRSRQGLFRKTFRGKREWLLGIVCAAVTSRVPQ